MTRQNLTTFPPSITLPPRNFSSTLVRSFTLILTATLATLTAWQPAYSQAGAPDPTFGTNGKTTLNFGLGYSEAKAIAVQSDGKIVVGGSGSASGNSDFIIARYNPDGTLDTSFGIGGRTIFNFGGEEDLEALVIQPDGKIVAAGRSYTTDAVTNDFTSNFLVARCNANGTLDSSFGTNGRTTTSFDGKGAKANAIALQPNGKIVAAGRTFSYSPNDNDSAFALVRYNADGTLDTAFGSGGRITTDFGGERAEANDVLLQADGKIVAVGDTYDGFLTARYNPDGTLDTAFDGDGKVTTTFGEGDHFGTSATIQPDGRIVIAGTSEKDSGNFIALARHNGDGSLDASFGTNGKVMTSFTDTSNDEAYDVAIQSNGKIVVAGSSEEDDGEGQDNLAIARYNLNGTLDSTFVTDFGDDDDYANAIALQTDGKIVVAVADDNSSKFVVARYDENGELDATFGANGKVTGDFASTDEATAIVVQPDGKIIVAGTAVNDDSFDFAIARYNPNGTLDTSFGENVKATLESNRFDVGYGYAVAYAVALQPDGKIVVAGTAVADSFDTSDQFGVTRNFALARFNADGTLDTTFGSTDFNTGGRTGRMTTDFSDLYANTSSPNSDDTAYAIILQPDGKIVAVGSNSRPTTTSTGSPAVFLNFALARYTADGNLDTSFDGDGRATASGSRAYAAALQPDGKIVAAGYGFGGSATQFDMLLVRFNTDGSRDTTFDGDGRAFIDFNGSTNDQALSVIVQPNGAIVVAGYARVDSGGSSPFDFALARLNPNGTLDTTFNGNGKVTTDFGTVNEDVATAITRQSNGKLVVAGYATLNSGNTAFAAARYNTDGTLDNSFGENGKITTDFGVSTDIANAVAIQANGNIVAAGRAFIGVTRDFAVARYLGDEPRKARSTGLGRRSRSR